MPSCATRTGCAAARPSWPRRATGINELEPLAEAVLDYVTRYLNGVVAAMYVRSDDGVLRRIGAYGFAHRTTSMPR
jgi:hypothetical protein